MKSDIEMGSEEEAYRKFIVICEDGDEDEEDVPQDEQDDSEIETDKMKKPNTKKGQFQKIIEFSNVYNEDNTGKSTLNELWEKLTIELNEMGPPTRTAMQWRRVWSIYKYNTKRAESSARDISSKARGASSQSRTRARGASSQSRTRARGNRRSASKSRSVRERSRSQTCSPETQETPTDERMLIQLGLLVELQSKMVQNQEAIMVKIDKANEMLAEIVGRKTSAQVPPLPFQSDE